MRELLERWRSLEPERCGPTTLAVHLGTPFAFRIHWAVLTADPINLAVIEARGWSFKARHLVGHSEASVEVRPAQSLLAWPYKATADTFTQALLGAYLAALEGAEQE